MAKKYPIGIQDFEKLRKEGYYYIDKTSYVYDLVEKGNYYFFSRPRRFGKSLLISTIEAYFEGKKNLFDGLAIAVLEKDWKKYPVLHLDLNTQRYETENSLLSLLEENVVGWEEKYGRNAAEVGIERRFAGVIRRAHEMTGERTVILVDEYDKPLLQTIDDEHLQDAYRTLLKAFYGALKSEDAHIRFAMLTGVTKFGKVSVFSDLNNLQDISMDERYADICGISEAELSENFSEDIRNLAEANGQSLEEASIALKERYDGYHFNPWTSYGLYNPFSLLNTFAKNRYGNYWFETGTPTYLVELLKRYRYNLYKMANEKVTSKILDSTDASSTNPIPVIYQSGYLTIKGYIPEPQIYELGFPNKEVEQGFMDFLLPYYTPVQDTESGFAIWSFVEDVKTGNIDGFMKRLQVFLSGCPYEMARDIELHYQNVLFIVFRLAGLYTQVEYHTSQGRIDLVLQTADYVYVMEFKLDGSAEEALCQIEEKQYALPFAGDSRKVYKIGVNFSSGTRNIERWMVK
ncbi:MAG: ATP-binding protein [Bacteroidetes bacterium]|uniref:ATP-binding protein n=1 Tax=Candidatus Cryptobacteroides merdigallinarum TaxID=2840770 RepID=A0A9D9EM95_9BACT|nr:ATP-binding protein [Candidatus Cryptobacteroides merdigallinarum]